MGNVNEPATMSERARPPVEIRSRRFGPLAGRRRTAPPDGAGRDIGAAAGGVGLTLDKYVMAALNGDQITRDRNCRSWPATPSPSSPPTPGDEQTDGGIVIAMPQAGTSERP